MSKKGWLKDFAADVTSLRSEIKLLRFWLQRDDLPKAVFLRTEMAVDFILMWRVFTATEKRFVRAGMRDDVWRQFDALQMDLLAIDELLKQNARLIHSFLQKGHFADARLMFLESLGPEQPLPWWLGGEN